MRGGSRLRGGGIGAQVFTPTQAPTCPAGQHWEGPAPGAVRGIAACVPNAVQLVPLHLRPTAPAAAPAPPAVALQPLTLPAPSTAAAAPAPAPAPAPCPPLWPWWYLLVAAGVGGALGYYAQKNQKAVKRNAGRVAGHAATRIVNRASEGAIARLL